MSTLPINKFIPSSGYYVYEILENGSTCYVGKGKGNRVLSHFKKSSCSTIGNKISATPKLFDWRIVDCFDNESDALDLERELIFKYRETGTKLYNTVHYTKPYGNWTLYSQIFKVLTQLSTMVFPKKDAILSVKEKGEIVFEILKDNLKTIPVDMMPVYSGIRIDRMGFRVVSVGEKEQLEYYEE